MSRAEWVVYEEAPDPRIETPLDSETFGEYLRELRRVRVNTEFSAYPCRGLLQARYDGHAESETGPAPAARARSGI